MAGRGIDLIVGRCVFAPPTWNVRYINLMPLTILPNQLGLWEVRWSRLVVYHLTFIFTRPLFVVHVPFGNSPSVSAESNVLFLVPCKSGRFSIFAMAKMSES